MIPPTDPKSPPPGPNSPSPRRSSKGGRWGSRRRSDSGVPWLPIAIVAVLLAGGAAWWFWLRDTPAPTAPDSLASDVVTPAEGGAGEAPVAVPPLELPTLAESDPVLQRVVGALSSNPRWAEWLVTDDLARRFVGAVAAVAAGVDPRERVPFLAPEGDFAVRSAPGGGTEVDPASWRRYDPITTAFVSFDSDAAVRLYLQLEPLFEEAHQELGFPEDSFGLTMATALDNVLAVQVPVSPPAVELDVKTYLFTDPALEAAPPVARQLMRLGPDNASRVQAKLRELRDALVRMEAIPRR